MDCKVMGGEDVDWTDLTQDIKKRRILVKKVMNLRFT
jgi:hypothetical protein